MHTLTAMKRLTIYVKSSEHYHGKPLYAAIVSECQRLGMAGATVDRCMEGYGGDHQLHTMRLFQLSETLPVRVEVIDTHEAVELLLDALRPIVAGRLIVVADVQVVRYSV